MEVPRKESEGGNRMEKEQPRTFGPKKKEQIRHEGDDELNRSQGLGEDKKV